MGKAEDATQHIPVIQRDIAEIHKDVLEVRDEGRGNRRALYTISVSVMCGSILFALSVFELFK